MIVPGVSKLQVKIGDDLGEAPQDKPSIKLGGQTAIEALCKSGSIAIEAMRENVIVFNSFHC